MNFEPLQSVATIQFADPSLLHAKCPYAFIQPSGDLAVMEAEHLKHYDIN
jgi:hypothetical protein